MVRGDSWVDSIVFQSLFELGDAVVDLHACLVNLLDGRLVELLGLLILKLELALLSFLLIGHVLLPVFDSLLQPFFHEPSVPLELVDLGSADFLLDPFGFLLLGLVVALCLFILADSLVIELLEVVLHVHGLLRFVQCLQARLEEGALHLVVSFLCWPDLQSRLVVSNFARLSKNSDVSWGIHFLEDHLELIKETQSKTSLLLHDLVHLSRVKFDLEVS